MTTFIPHTWGPLYETLKEMERNGDEHKDEKLKYAFELFNKLDNAKSLLQIRNFVKHGLKKISPTEQKRLCSPCFDGIVETVNSNRPIELIVYKYPPYPQYIEAFKYYLPKLQLGRNNKLDLRHYFYENNRIDYEVVFYSYYSLDEFMADFCAGSPKMVEKLKILTQKMKENENDNFFTHMGSLI